MNDVNRPRGRSLVSRRLAITHVRKFAANYRMPKAGTRCSPEQMNSWPSGRCKSQYFELGPTGVVLVFETVHRPAVDRKSRQTLRPRQTAVRPHRRCGRHLVGHVVRHRRHIDAVVRVHRRHWRHLAASHHRRELHRREIVHRRVAVVTRLAVRLRRSRRVCRLVDAVRRPLHAAAAAIAHEVAHRWRRNRRRTPYGGAAAGGRGSEDWRRLVVAIGRRRRRRALRLQRRTLFLLHQRRRRRRPRLVLVRRAAAAVVTATTAVVVRLALVASLLLLPTLGASVLEPHLRHTKWQ